MDKKLGRFGSLSNQLTNQTRAFKKVWITFAGARISNFDTKTCEQTILSHFRHFFSVSNLKYQGKLCTKLQQENTKKIT